MKMKDYKLAGDFFADMRMSSSMYEVFSWNVSSDPPLTPAKSKRASLSLPPTSTDIFAIDDKPDSDTRRSMIHRGASGESRNQSLHWGIKKKELGMKFKFVHLVGICISNSST